ncbi:MAG TPA: hypothetical protein VNM92_02985 [Thermoanaerobaculia bacterium]|nr:hypothetical protein [Thermoanaerobaculia bacterium]
MKARVLLFAALLALSATTIERPLVYQKVHEEIRRAMTHTFP